MRIQVFTFFNAEKEGRKKEMKRGEKTQQGVLCAGCWMQVRQGVRGGRKGLDEMDVIDK